jgi:hypothetical protein
MLPGAPRLERMACSAASHSASFSSRDGMLMDQASSVSGFKITIVI